MRVWVLQRPRQCVFPVVPLDEQVPVSLLAVTVGRDLPAVVLEVLVQPAEAGDGLALGHVVQRPADDDAVDGWVKEVWPRAEG